MYLFKLILLLPIKIITISATPRHKNKNVYPKYPTSGYKKGGKNTFTLFHSAGLWPTNKNYLTPAPQTSKIIIQHRP
jgi:hypothetical protein